MRAELEGLGFAVSEDGAGTELGGESGNLLCRIPGPDGAPSVLLCAHLDTVPDDGVPIAPVIVDAGWVNANDGILGADNKAAVALMLSIAHRAAEQGLPCGVELLFTVAEEIGLLGAHAFDVAGLTSTTGYVFDHATPIGEIVASSPTYYRLQADFRGKAAHAGIRPEDGRSAVVAAARAVASMPHGRVDPETTANVGSIRGGDGTNVVPDRCRVLAEVRSLSDASAEATVAELVDRCYDAANDPECACDVDLSVERLFAGYRHATSDPVVQAAEAALRAHGHTPKRILTGGGSDANALQAKGFSCANVANGTEHNHEPLERVSVAALEGMLDVTLSLLDEVASR